MRIFGFVFFIISFLQMRAVVSIQWIRSRWKQAMFVIAIGVSVSSTFTAVAQELPHSARTPLQAIDPSIKKGSSLGNRLVAQAEVEFPTPVGPELVTPASPESTNEPTSPVRQLEDREEVPTPVGPDPLSPVAPELPPPAQTESDLPSEQDRPKSEKPVVGQVEAVLLQRGGILLPKGYLQIQPSIEFTHFSNSRFTVSGLTLFQAIIIGRIQVDDLKRDILTSSITARYGLFNRLQFEARVPHVYRRDQEIFEIGTTQEQSRVTSNHNIGDIEGALDYQLIIGEGNIPDVILRVRGKSRTGKDAFKIRTIQTQGGQTVLEKPPTGSGFYSVGPGFSLVWRSDPLVLFTGANYTFNLKRDVGGTFGTIDPGDTLDFNFGFNLAVSERIGLNMFFSNAFTLESTQNGVDTVGSDFNDARLSVGSSISVNPSLTFLISGSVGLTNESPDYVFTVSLPFTTKLF